VSGPRARAEALTRYVNATLQKKPTVSIPSAREVLRPKLATATSTPRCSWRCRGRSPAFTHRGGPGVRARAFYYHAWPEVYIEDRANRGYWLPVDPTFNQFPADATHLRLARGGLEKQAAILPMIGNLQMTIVDLDVTPESTPILWVARRPRACRRPWPICRGRANRAGACRVS
jgi:transglutaminase-like putative cysteine protease